MNGARKFLRKLGANYSMFKPIQLSQGSVKW